MAEAAASSYRHQVTRGLRVLAYQYKFAREIDIMVEKFGVIQRATGDWWIGRSAGDAKIFAASPPN
jgi:hypothetical protein